MKMEPIEGSGTSAFRTQTPGNYPKENILHTKYIVTSHVGLLSTCNDKHISLIRYINLINFAKEKSNKRHLTLRTGTHNLVHYKTTNIKLFVD